MFVRNSVLDHIKEYPESIIVLEVRSRRATAWRPLYRLLLLTLFFNASIDQYRHDQYRLALHTATNASDDLLAPAPPPPQEYDKADADTRGVLRQLIDGGRAHNVSLGEAADATFLNIL